MTKNISPKPDYKFWATKETWSLHQAALLLNGIDPLKNRSLRLTQKDLPQEFEESHKTYILLQSIPWRDRHANYYIYGVGAHPVAIIYEAKHKNLPIPTRLLKFVAKRYERELALKKEHEEQEKLEQQKHAISNDQTIQEQNSAPASLTSRERKNLMKAIGVLVNVLMDEKMKSQRSGQKAKISALQISQMMLDKAQELGIEIEGLKSFDRKITEALDLLQEEII